MNRAQHWPVHTTVLMGNKHEQLIANLPANVQDVTAVSLTESLTDHAVDWTCCALCQKTDEFLQSHCHGSPNSLKPPMSIKTVMAWVSTGLHHIVSTVDNCVEKVALLYHYPAGQKLCRRMDLHSMHYHDYCHTLFTPLSTIHITELKIVHWFTMCFRDARMYACAHVHVSIRTVS